jgi:hypothetical protein
MRQGRLLISVLSALAVHVFAAPALAAAPAVWDGPAADATVERHFTGPVTYRLDEASPIRFAIAGPGGYAWETTATPAPGDVGGTFSLAVDPFAAPGLYTATVSRLDGTDPDVRSWNVARTNEVSILSPVSGSFFLTPYVGPIRVRFTEVRDPAGSYSLLVNGVAQCQWSDIADGSTLSCSPVGIGVGSWTATVRDDGTSQILADASFIVLSNLAISSRSAGPLTFYPLVREGFRDNTWFRFTLNQEAIVTLRIRNRSGRVVRTANLGRVSTGSWRWNGQSNSGAKVRPGRYRIDLLARTAVQSKRSSAVTVTVKTALVTRYGRKRYPGGGGPGTIQGSPGNLCLYSFDFWWAGDLFLDCWGLGWIRSNYIFTIPASTFRTSFSVAGRQFCCSQGVFAKTGERTARTRYRVRVTVGGWRSYAIRHVTLNWAYKKRI